MNWHQTIIEKTFRIVDRHGNDQPYKLWGSQVYPIDCFSRSLDDPMCEGHLVLKAASVGFTSGCLAFGMAEALTRENRTMALLTHSDDLSQLLLRRAKYYIKNAMAVKHPGIVFPEIIGDSKGELEFENGSLIYIGTAASNTDICRGNPINIFIGSECAFWKNPNLIPALIPRLSGFKVFESTANGAQGWFYTQFKAGELGEGIYRNYFIPWWKHHEYTVAGNVILDNKTEEEVELQEIYGIDDGRILWRRRMVKKLDNDTMRGLAGDEAFRQEYPSNWEEAFLKSGSPIFGPRVYNIVKETMMEPVFVGDFA